METNSERQARGTDRADCQGPPDFIVTGSGTVTVNSKPAARSSDKTMHLGAVVMGSGNVMIGGPTVGVTLGNPDAGKAACIAAAAGRDPPAGAIYPPEHPRAGQQIPGHRTKQSYNNCGVEACRIIINRATHNTIGEDELLNWAMDQGDATGNPQPAARYASGTTAPWDRADILRQFGVESTQERQTMDNIGQGVAEGKGVITTHDSALLWDDPDAPGLHVVVVTGVTYDADGKAVTVITLDTGTGNCATSVPAGRFDRSLKAWPNKVNITKKPIW